MSDNQAGKKKRQVKNPETFRERAQKAAEAGDKPATATARRIKDAGGKAAKPVAGPVRRTLGQFFALKPIRVVGKIIWPSYFRQSWQELKLVTWPNWKESRRLTFAVLVFAVIFGAAIAGVDWILDKVFRHLLIQ